ncbi:unnamed protein product [Spirodela intermedia]|uniref:Uncharacterized protein n=2 Tax=Spirodela intermedia TaxID=51605 RepID=A0A7I8KLF3_SPIIN|nr:unnamed protein product [Spirodela intermedia]CAA6662097.1 unnamed protein product [Spirodela intermedia]CAA7398481.1 unnamed protein product [Spirodela intermedia]
MSVPASSLGAIWPSLMFLRNDRDLPAVEELQKQKENLHIVIKESSRPSQLKHNNFWFHILIGNDNSRRESKSIPS